MSSDRIVVFDLDGTLVDTAPDLINALNFVLAREGLPPVPLQPELLEHIKAVHATFLSVKGVALPPTLKVPRWSSMTARRRTAMPSDSCSS